MGIGVVISAQIINK